MKEYNVGNTQRLDRILSNSGYGTRKEVKKLIKQGMVKVDGITVTDNGMHIDPTVASIDINGEILSYREFIYIMMNKPAGVISATFDNKNRTVVDLLSDEYKVFDLFPVGRLDIDTEGLILLTNDGNLTHQLLSPKKCVPKKYYAIVQGDVTEKDVEKFRSGVVLDDGYKTMPAELEIINDEEVELVIYEGKFHQVKRMFESVGKKVKYLRRVAMGGVKLDKNLKNGNFRDLTEEEIRILKQYVK
ncbi:MAG TPA: rRNA pseudouridine synthase [Clostridiaceae bacterium]|jgi:16S rRNA pseudouridine516 synthase|nr:rRNA pseudouridine synthase [Clostridiaceae bacterium]